MSFLPPLTAHSAGCARAFHRVWVSKIAMLVVSDSRVLISRLYRRLHRTGPKVALSVQYPVISTRAPPQAGHVLLSHASSVAQRSGMLSLLFHHRNHQVEDLDMDLGRSCTKHATGAC
jgi:hypothetical protein